MFLLILHVDKMSGDRFSKKGQWNNVTNNDMKGRYCESMSRICIKSFFASHSQLFRNQK